MRVISQNRNYSFDFDRTVFWKQNNIIYGKIDDDSNILFGSYKSNERASEVFMDMHNAYAPVYSISDAFTEDQIREMLIKSKNIVVNNITNVGQDACITTFDNYVYLMPEE